MLCFTDYSYMCVIIYSTSSERMAAERDGAGVCIVSIGNRHVDCVFVRI